MARFFLPKACLFSSMQLLREVGQMFAGKNWQSFGKFIEFFNPVYTKIPTSWKIFGNIQFPRKCNRDVFVHAPLQRYKIIYRYINPPNVNQNFKEITQPPLLLRH
jgi:hypothetical protein